MGLQYPDGGLITETNANYYAGQQHFKGDASTTDFQCTFETQMVIGIPTVTVLSNFEVYKNGSLMSTGYTLSATTPNLLVFGSAPLSTDNILVKLTNLAVEDNYGGYEYITLGDVIENFLVGYVGEGKLIPKVKRTDVMFHSKRGLQEFSYDTLRSIKSQELTIPPSLAVAIPQDYVNYVKVSWVDQAGVKRIIYPAEPNLTSNPTQLPIQDSKGVPTQDNEPGVESNLEAAQSQTEERWNTFNQENLIGEWNEDAIGVYDWQYWKLFYGQRYGLAPELTQQNGWYTINRRTGMFNFSSNLAGQLIILEYISDGLAYEQDTKIPKFAEEALYMHIAYGILSTRSNVPEYIVQRFRRRRSAELRNAKIRLSNIKLEEFTQLMRGKSKWIKH
jgi:hypothetical protein